MVKVLVFAPNAGPRVRYAANLIFRDFLGGEVQVMSDAVAYQQAEEAVKVNYSSDDSLPGLHLQPAGLLSQKGLAEQTISPFQWDGAEAFFAVSAGALPFDLLAAAFYLISRYEEYLPHRKDRYHRFDLKESCAYRHGFLEKPLVDIWVLRLRSLLEEAFPGATFPRRAYRFTPTIDVDNAYAFLEKGLMRTVGAFARSLYRLDVRDLTERAQTLLGWRHDPYDTFEYQLAIQKTYQLEPIYFFLVADYGLNDKNVPITSRKFQALIKRINDYADVGLHPSFGSNADPARLKLELERLSGVLHLEVRKSRQHFLKLSMPGTYRNLLDLGITDDYTMGYAAAFGFRASTSLPFYFYDLDQERETTLKVHPFCVMEATFKYYLRVPPEEALDHIRPMVQSVRDVNGSLMCVWHNDSLSNHRIWQGWQGLYEAMVQLAVP